MMSGLISENFKRIVLIGFRGVGKTTVGKKLSEMTNWKYISTDDLIKEATGQPISYLVETKGWKNFRKIENDVIQALRNETEVIIDCGGGVVENSDNVNLLLSNSLIVWIDAEISDIKERISQDDDRPLLSHYHLEDDILNNYKRRFPLYQFYAHICLNSSKDSVEELCQKIISYMKKISE
jgi:shikimate kinase